MSSPETSSRKNLVFICLDQLGAQAIGPYGNRLTKTPNMDRLAARGVVFDNFWCVSPLCGPARFSMFTGHMPFPNRHASASCQHYPYLNYMGDYFQAQDYATFSVGKLHGIPRQFDFGFNHCHINDLCLNTKLGPGSYSHWLYEKMAQRPDGASLREAVELHRRAGWYNCDRTLEEDYFLPQELSENSWIAETSATFLDNLSEDRPFMMHIGINHPHGAWFIRPDADEHVRPEEIRLPKNFHTHWNSKSIPANANAEPFMMEHITEHWSGHDWKRWLAKYYTSVNQADKAIGAVLDLLINSGRMDDTYIILTTDHGDMLGQFKLEAKYFFYNGSARIPFLISGPGIPNGERRTQLADQLDLIPTMLDLAGARIPEYLEGVSLRMASINSSAPTKLYVHGCLFFRGRRLTMTLSERYKLCGFFGSGVRLDLGRAAELYDMRNDPEELHDLFGEINNSDVRKLVANHVQYFSDYNIREPWIKEYEREKVNIPPRARSEMPVPLPVAATFDRNTELKLKQGDADKS